MQIIAGVDEAGRGCLAGPVVAGAVVLPLRYPKKYLQDSKILSEKHREIAYEWITTKCVFGIGEASHHEIDRLGIKRATHLAMVRAVAMLIVCPDLLRVDGCDHFRFDLPSEEIIRGDALFPEISAASIIAKVTRDRKMRDFATQFPEFDFANNKGYGVKKHLNLVMSRQYTAIHRLSFDPLRTALSNP